MITEANAKPSGPDTREPQLITRAQQGDADAFGELYRMHHNVVAASISRVSKNPTLTEDLTADTFVKAWAKIRTFTWTGTSLAAWLITIAGNVVADHYKRASTRRLTLVAELEEAADAWAAPSQTTEETVLASLDAAGLRTALERIAPRHRYVLQRRYLEDRSVPEVATELGISTGATKTMAYRAIISLRRQYEAVAV
ncbi:RNA polymerase sigma factor [Streptomyces sp. NPDC001588]